MPVQLIGLPFDGKSSYMKGSALAPNRIREELRSDAYNPYAESMRNVLSDDALTDEGNIEAAAFADVFEEISEIMTAEHKPLFLGGDHSLAYQAVKACHEMFGPFHILQFDAHNDLYPDFDGDIYSHACPFARILDEGLALSLTQVGIRASTPVQREQIMKYGVKEYSMRKVNEFDPASLQGPLYISLDMDAFDPGFAPGVSHHESGGLSPRQFLNWLGQIDVPIIGADLVEFNPLMDVKGLTAALCAKMVKELIDALMK